MHVLDIRDIQGTYLLSIEKKVYLMFMFLL